MQDTPDPPEILETVAALLRDEILPALSGRERYAVRVAANAVDLVRRQMLLGDASDAVEAASLRALLGADGTLSDLNQRLCDDIENHAIAIDDPALIAHLWDTTLAKLAVDQPAYRKYAAIAQAR